MNRLAVALAVTAPILILALGAEVAGIVLAVLAASVVVWGLVDYQSRKAMHQYRTQQWERRAHG